MMDPKKKISESENNGSAIMKSCSDCYTTRTPLWRGGPAGPKSLCNACGIKYNKKRRQLLGLERVKKHKGNKSQKKSSNEVRRPVKLRLMALGGEMVVKRSGGRKLEEEEEAAILLMALSCVSESSKQI